MVLTGKIVVPYSNAHLNDLFRGFKKNPNYINEHLDNIERLSKNLCICQYWSNKEAVWHFHEIREFFDAKKTEWEFEPNSFGELFDSSLGIRNTMLLYKMIPLPKEWKLGYRQDPMFGILYPKSKIKNNMYSLMEDVFNFQNQLKSDFSLYKSFKVNLMRSMNKLKNNKEMLKVIK